MELWLVFLTILMISCCFQLQHNGAIMGQELSNTFYATSCPDVDTIVRNTVVNLMNQSNVVAPSVLRLFVHDCLVLGCDGSILITSTDNNVAERDFVDNQNIPAQAFAAVFLAKHQVERHCPDTVSCADILAMIARDVVFLMGGPDWEVPKGRRDGLVSQASRVSGLLPASTSDVQQLAYLFGNLGLSVEDMVILSGAHTIGFSHCDQVVNRLYNFNTTSYTDPTMDAHYASHLQELCPLVDEDPDTTVAFDADTSFTFDNKYYLNLLSGRGLLSSDQVLFTDPSTRALVFSLAASQDTFFQAFAHSMLKLSLVGVKTGTDGEIRNECSQFNTLSTSSEHQ